MKSEYYLRSKWTYITIPKQQFFEMEEIILMVRMIKLMVGMIKLMVGMIKLMVRMIQLMVGMVMTRLCGGLGPPTKYRLWPLALTV